MTATQNLPPWIAMIQAHADQAENDPRRAPLSPEAVTYLAEQGITRREWIAEHGHLGAWTGDRCGCPDNRCAGHHHDEGADCMCLTVLAAEYVDERSAR